MIGEVMPMKRLRPLIVSVAAVCVLVSPALAISGTDALKRLNHDSDQILELPEALDAAAKQFQELNKDNDLTLDKAETAGLVTDAEWKAHNKDHDGTLELDEWLNIVRARFRAADTKNDGKLTAQELDSPAGQALLKLVVGQQ
jgi:EF hand